MKAPIALCIMLGLSSIASAELKLTDGDHVSVKPKPEDETAKIVFAFINSGTKPVKVTHIESACSCLSATLDRAVYEPGQKGTGTAEFKVSSFTGEQEKTVVVTTDDPQQAEWTVPFIVSVPVVVDIEPKMVQWFLNEEPRTKELTVKMTGKDDMALTKVESTRENMGVSFKEVKAGREYRVILTPKSTADIMIGAVKISTDSKIPKYQRQLGFFGVVRQPESAKAGETILKPEAPTAKK
jgi:Protein of unknown function (DUF1573)